MRCDGLVAATPAGSTGYNLANQGPILAWGVKGYVVSYIAPHTLTARPLVVAPERRAPRSATPAGREPVDVALDGEPAGELAPGRGARGPLRDGVGRLAQLPGSSFYHRIREKFGHLGRLSRSRHPVSSGFAPMERKWWTLLAVCVATFMLLLDVTIVNVALPDIQREPRRQPLEPAVGRRRLRADPRRLPARRRLARRPARPPARLHDRLRDLHPRLVPLRDRRRPDPAEPGPRPAGHRRRGDVRDLAGADRPGVPGPRARHRDRRLGRDGRRRGRGRPAGRRRCSPSASAGSGSSSSTSRSGSRRSS